MSSPETREKAEEARKIHRRSGRKGTPTQALPVEYFKKQSDGHGAY